MIDDMVGAMRGRRPMQKAETDEHARRARAARRFDVEDAVADQRRAAATAPLDHREGRSGGGLRRAWTPRVAANDRRPAVREPPFAEQLRSEERRGGEECVRRWNARWKP